MSGRGDQLRVAAWLSPGLPEHVPGVRHWARAVAAAWGAHACDAGLVVTELVTNAIRHTRSGLPGGTVTVAIAGGWDGVTVHVHDLGADPRPERRPRLAAVDGDGLADGGRGLLIVAAAGERWGMIPAAWCPVWGPGDPAAEAGGSCTWCHLAAGAGEPGRDERDGGAR